MDEILAVTSHFATASMSGKSIIATIISTMPVKLSCFGVVTDYAAEKDGRMMREKYLNSQSFQSCG